MILLVSKTLNKSEADILLGLQGRVDAEVTFTSRASRAQSLWDSKGNVAGKAAFVKIREKLEGMCVFVGLCNYCEQSEANDIEHIHPKSFFPQYSFDWSNYILACKQCNSGHKLDKGYVIDGQDELVGLVRGNEPPFATIGFINIRTEDPQYFMMLNPITYKFEIFAHLSKAEKNKAQGTLNILELNERDTLLAARKSAARHYYEMLDRLVKMLGSKSMVELEQILTPYDDLFDLTRPLSDIKVELLASFKKYISTYQHPSVWQTIKLIHSKTDSRWKSLFEKLPDALNW
ncbi:HNH endonuclease [Pedobacter polysacchareus]|uniref:HNH endonuclease n=1 Tax=Pedobacter polysacchareus TaxID=2861973 RepID=UPI001C995C39|nr:HNH endonuclease [Pedobacter polysacchareus]